MKNRAIVYFTIIMSSFFSTTSFSSKQCAENISVQKAIDQAQMIVPANQFSSVVTKINNQALKGGMEITVRNLNSIISQALSNPTPATVTAKPEKTLTATKKAGDESLSSILEKIRLSESTPSEAKTLPVARTLHSKITYLVTEDQGTDECGYHVVFNAKIIQGLAPAEITGAAINAQKKSFKNKICQEQIFDDEIIILANQEGISNFYILQYSGTETDPLVIMQRSKDSSNDIGEVIASLQGTKAARAYFAINSGAHWVLAIVVKQAGSNKPKLYYINSLNSPLTEEYGAYKTLVALTKALGL